MGPKGPEGPKRRGAGARPRCAKPRAARDRVFACYDGHHRGRGEAAPVCPALACIAPQGILFWGRERVSHPAGCFHTGHWGPPSLRSYGVAFCRIAKGGLQNGGCVAGLDGDWLGRWTRSGCCACPPSLRSYGVALCRGFKAGFCKAGTSALRCKGEAGAGALAHEGSARVAAIGKEPDGRPRWQATRHDPPRPATTRHDPPRPATTRHDPPRPATTRGYFIFLCWRTAIMGTGRLEHGLTRTHTDHHGRTRTGKMLALLPPSAAARNELWRTSRSELRRTGASLRSNMGSTDWLPKPCKSGAHTRRSLREKQSRPTFVGLLARGPSFCRFWANGWAVGVSINGRNRGFRGRGRATAGLAGLSGCLRERASAGKNP
ncbi:MAG: hypothetical protein JWR26_1423 [Pedosphaera sp.]|nr:hypothetical protein [Pedosphaera sp.]